MPEPLELVGVFEEAGAIFVDDDFLFGSRLLRQHCPSTGSPLDRLADRYLTSEPFPGYLYEGPARRDFVSGLVRDSKAEGIVFWDLKFCEPYNFDFPDLNRHFEATGVPTFHIETDLQMSGIGQLRTRVQAFLEQFTLER